ncbi:MAG TPA: ATP-binding protein [Syntrophorhabdaceae bacterium]|jgi:anti-sigma regulatory factor (Ser/Thr protein kinase)
MNALSHAVVAAKLENLEALISHVAESARDAGFDSKRISELQIAAEEALVNVMSYAYESEGGDVDVACGPTEHDRFMIEISDKGAPFDPLSAVEPDTSADVTERKIGGLGILLIRKLMDEVRYRHEDGKNILTLLIRKGRNPGD